MIPTSFPLSSGDHIPSLGFGTWQLQGTEAAQAVRIALETGYRGIDTADMYGNHREVGQALREVGVPREELFVTTKVWREQLTVSAVASAIERFLDELQLEYLDLVLIHWPNRAVPMQETLQALQQAKEAGKIKHLGVSNFTINHLEQAQQAGVMIENNQVELHPTLAQTELQAWCEAHRILVTAYSPIAQGADLSLPLIQELAATYRRSPSQIILNWIISRGIVAIPRSAKPEHIQDNFGCLEFALSSDDVARISRLNQGARLVCPAWAEF